MSLIRCGCIAVLLLRVAPSSAQDQVSPSPIDGDVKLLKMVIDAQRANLERYPFGDMDVIAKSGPLGQPYQRRVQARVRWDGDHQRLTGVATDLAPEGDGGMAKYLEKSFDLLYRDKRSFMYVAEHHRMTVADIAKSGPYELTFLRPRDCWYGSFDGRGSNWADTYEAMLRIPADVLKHVRARRLDEDRVEIARDKGASGSFRALFSLKDDGNMVSYHTEFLERGQRQERSYSWSRDSKGRCYLAACRIERQSRVRRSRTGNEQFQVVSISTYEVSRFDAETRPAPSIFELRDLKVAPGTLIDDRITGKRRKLGDRPEEDMGKLLDKLVPELKSRGLADPDREN